MLTLDSGRLSAVTIPIGTGWLLGACMEAHGKQDLWVKQKPEVLSGLREQASPLRQHALVKNHHGA